MRDTLPLLDKVPFPAIRRGKLETLQVNVGYRCNQSCVHCHVNAGPNRTEEMTARGRRRGARFLARRQIGTLDITGGAPEAQREFPPPGARGARLGVKVMDRCNLTILERAGPGGPRRVSRRATASRSSPRCPATCRTMSTASAARACSTASIRGLKTLNALGYGRDPALALNLVYNPQGPALPPPQGGARSRLQARARRAIRHRVQPALHARQHADPALRLHADHQGRVRRLSAAAAGRASRRQSRRRDVPPPDLGRLAGLCLRLRLQPDARPAARAAASARGCISPTSSTTTSTGNPIRVADHCYGCTAGQGSSCGGALKEAAE